SITHSTSGNTVSSINDVEPGEVITTQVEDGVIESQVTTRVAKSEL
ncbi:exodeoxyribonuclease VII large subunit, partial [Vibrio cyclitrophicus]